MRNQFDATYCQLVRRIMTQGCYKMDRTGVGIKSIFGYQMRFDLRQGFPLLTTKKVNFDAIVYELLWFLRGDTNIHYLLAHNVNIWTDWPYKNYCTRCPQRPLSMTAFKASILADRQFAQRWGELGPVYGQQWRNCQGVDQIQELIQRLKANPHSRRHIICAWNVAQVRCMLLPPCHLLVQFYVNDAQELSCQLYQRSGDVFLGVPFNIASYALLTCMIAQVCGFRVREFVHTIGDAHLYVNHLPQAQRQAQRAPYPPPQLVLDPHVTSVFAFQRHHIQLVNYQHHGRLPAPIAV